jgi:ABC-type branched-subunit amino acid transport system substrate-binding protein
MFPETSRRRKSATGIVLLVAGMLATAGLVGIGATPAGAQVRGFDGTTIKVAGMGIAGQLPKTEVGAKARIKRFNDDHEIKGVNIQWTEMADDKQDPATALSEARRLVTQVGVFALVGDISATNPGQYFKQQKVPYFGGGFDETYCSPKASTQVWGFSDGGCITPSNPSFISDIYHTMYTDVTKKSGKTHPTFVIFSQDNQSGKNSAKIFAVAAQGTGFKVTGSMSTLPDTPPADYSPYVNQLLTAGANGGAPDSMFCAASASECLGIWTQLKARGYKGVFTHGIWTNALVKPFAGTTINNPTVNPLEKNAGMDQLKADLEAVQPGSSADVDFGAIVGYTSADMFIQALKAAARKGKSNITPENVQKAASTMTWELKGVQGPIQYPKSTVDLFPACFSNYESNGSEWATAVPYSCSTKTFSPNLKVG